MHLEEPVGTLLLCDYVGNDRGKWNLLGGGWTRCSPGRDHISAFAVIQLPPEQEEGPLEIRVNLWTIEQFDDELGDPHRSVSLEAEWEVSAEGETTPPSFPTYIPFVLPVDLEPEMAYVLELLLDSDPLAWSTFETVEEGEVIG